MRKDGYDRRGIEELGREERQKRTGDEQNEERKERGQRRVESR